MLPHSLKMPSKIPAPLSCAKGNRYKVTYSYEYDEKLHCPRRVVSGKIDLQDYIQQSADDVDFKAIGKMLVDTRDNVISHFTDDKGETLDITRLPRNIHEYEALHNKMKASFDSLDPEVKKLFQDDFDLFAKSWKNGSIKGIFDTYNAAKKVEAEPTPSAQKVEGE